MEQDVGNPHFSRSECNDINSYFHEPGEISFPVVESPTANQRIQYALQEGDFFSVTNPQNRVLLTVSSLETSSVDTSSNAEDSHQSHFRNKERQETSRNMVVLPLHLSAIRHPRSGIFPSLSSASSVVEQLLQPLHTKESPRRGISNNDNDSQSDEEKRAIEDFHKSCASNFFFFLGAFFYFMMDWLDVYDVFLFPNKGYSVTDAYVLVFWNRTITTLELEEYDSNYTMEYYDVHPDSTYYANYYGESWSNINSTSTFSRYTEVLKNEPLVTVSISMCFYILGSLCFLLNAIIDFQWAKRLTNEVKLKRKSKHGSQDFPPLSAKTTKLQLSQERCISSKACQLTSSSRSDDIELYRKQLQNTAMAELVDHNEQYGDSGCGTSSSTIMRRVVADVHKLPPCQIHIRRAFYPRRETSVKEKIAVLFGLAAVIDFVAALCYDSAPRISNDAYITAAHLYAAQAFVSIFGKETSSSSSLQSLPLLPSAEDVGDALFFAGSMIDVIMSYFYALPRLEKSPTFVACSCFASALWLFDSIVYIISTAQSRRHLYEDTLDEDECLMKGLGLSLCGPNSHSLEYCHDGSSHSVT
jgi:hypothetical protein